MHFNSYVTYILHHTTSKQTHAITTNITMPITSLCFVLPTDTDDKPVDHDHDHDHDRDLKQLDIRSHKQKHKHRLCNIHIPDVIRRALARLYHTRINIRSCGFCHHGAWGRNPSIVFHDTEGVHFPNEKAFTGHSPKTFSYSELYIGTKGFSKDEILGSGGFGRVYRAVLPRDGTIVAVKCLMETGERFEKTFVAELSAVANLRHRNLVPLRGWCVHDDQLLLVYEYMPNRSLDRVLFGRGGAKLQWDRRLKIVIGLGAALFYIHEQLEGQIIHRDVKTSNVMLDSSYNARLGDFGLARWLEHELKYHISTPSANHRRFRAAETTRIGGTIGYLSPESFHTGTATAKSDVFSFGIVLLEIVSGRKAIDLTFPDDKIILLDWVRELSDENMTSKAVDRRLKDGSYKVHDVERLIKLGLLCTLHDPKSRPDMKWILESLIESLSGTYLDLPDIPSFKTYPRYISISPPVSSSNVTDTTTTPSSLTNAASSAISASTITFVTAKGDSLYVTASVGYTGGNDMIPSMISGSNITETGYSITDSMISSTVNSNCHQSKIFPMVRPPREITYNEIISATDNFADSNRLAELDFGTAYYGVIDNQDVIVKRLGLKTCPALRVRFSNELSNLGRLCHRNLVQLHGWCTEQGEMLVVYNYSASRMLSQLLSHHNHQRSQPVLKWTHRYNILKSLANAVHYLHDEWEQQVIHRNITSSAIGIELDMNPRLGSFALAEFLTRNEHDHHVEVNTSVNGIFGYMAPEYMESGVATTMVDVYSFGVVVLEVVSGQMAVDFRTPDVLLVKRVHEFETRKRDYKELVDSRLNGEYDHEELTRLVKLGMACTRSNPESRPTMSHVVSILDKRASLKERMIRKEKSEEWKERNMLSLSILRRVQALGIQ